MKKSICVQLSFVLLFIMAGCGNVAAEGAGKRFGTGGSTDRTIHRS